MKSHQLRYQNLNNPKITQISLRSLQNVCMGDCIKTLTQHLLRCSPSLWQPLLSPIQHHFWNNSTEWRSTIYWFTRLSKHRFSNKKQHVYYSLNRIQCCFCIKDITIQADGADNHCMHIWTNPTRKEIQQKYKIFLTNDPLQNDYTYCIFQTYLLQNRTVQFLVSWRTAFHPSLWRSPI